MAASLDSVSVFQPSARATDELFDGLSFDRAFIDHVALHGNRQLTGIQNLVFVNGFLVKREAIMQSK